MATDVTKDVKDKVLLYFYKLLNQKMNPQLHMIDVELNLHGKNDIEKGMLDFITSTDENLSFSANLALNQGHRSVERKRYGDRYYKKLGPELTIFDFYLPKFKYDKVKGYDIWGDSISNGSLKYMKNEYDLPNYAHGGAIECKHDKLATLTGEDIIIKNFGLKIKMP